MVVHVLTLFTYIGIPEVTILPSCISDWINWNKLRSGLQRRADVVEVDLLHVQAAAAGLDVVLEHL